MKYLLLVIGLMSWSAMAQTYKYTEKSIGMKSPIKVKGIVSYAYNIFTFVDSDTLKLEIIGLPQNFHINNEKEELLIVVCMARLLTNTEIIDCIYTSVKDETTKDIVLHVNSVEYKRKLFYTYKLARIPE